MYVCACLTFLPGFCFGRIRCWGIGAADRALVLNTICAPESRRPPIDSFSAAIHAMVSYCVMCPSYDRFAGEKATRLRGASRLGRGTEERLRQAAALFSPRDIRRVIRSSLSCCISLISLKDRASVPRDPMSCSLHFHFPSCPLSLCVFVCIALPGVGS